MFSRAWVLSQFIQELNKWKLRTERKKSMSRWFHNLNTLAMSEIQNCFSELDCDTGFKHRELLLAIDISLKRWQISTVSRERKNLDEETGSPISFTACRWWVVKGAAPQICERYFTLGFTWRRKVFFSFEKKSKLLGYSSCCYTHVCVPAKITFGGYSYKT